MLGNFDLGHLRIIYVNDIPLLVNDTQDIFPQQEMEEIRLLQGGPRSNVYKIGQKTFSGRLEIPFYLDKDGNVSDACKEVLMCADDPFKDFSIKMNFGVMGEERTALHYQSKWGTDYHRRIIFETCAILEASLSGGADSPLTLSVSFEGLPDPETEEDYDFTPVSSDLMSRQCSLADCIFTRGDDSVFHDTIVEFSLSIKNDIKRLTLIPWINNGDDENSARDYAHYLYMGEGGTSITAKITELTKASDWSNELLTWNHGGYSKGEEMKMRFADVLARIRDPLYGVQTQRLTTGTLKRDTNITALFRTAYLSESETDNLIFADLR